MNKSIISTSIMVVRRRVTFQAMQEDAGSFKGKDGKEIRYTKAVVAFGDLEAENTSIFASPQIIILLNPKRDSGIYGQLKACSPNDRGTLTFEVKTAIYDKIGDGSYSGDTEIRYTDFVKEE